MLFRSPNLIKKAPFFSSLSKHPSPPHHLSPISPLLLYKFTPTCQPNTHHNHIHSFPFNAQIPQPNCFRKQAVSLKTTLKSALKRRRKNLRNKKRKKKERIEETKGQTQLSPTPSPWFSLRERKRKKASNNPSLLLSSSFSILLSLSTTLSLRKWENP